MKEIEVKFRVSDLAALGAKLEAAGCVLGDMLEQDDQVFLPAGSTYPVEAGTPVLRIRQQGTHPAVLTLKKHDKGNQLSKLEIETEVSEPGAAARIILELGYVEAVRVQKRRRTGKVGDVEVCLDEVVGLGAFVEFERITPEEPKQVQAELVKLAATFGIETKDQVMHGYDVLKAGAA